MKAVTRKQAIRCAIYTRKSSEEGLEQEFNSLAAQREACSSYIKRQRHEGWVEVKGTYDDGGFSGGNMERPGLKRLMDDVKAGRVEVIVVYKVDRLTRSLSDFARIVDVLDARGASFVSVTQAFNTTSSMGRLTLDVLLSFAQFEREVTGERIRDRIAASKRKGMWMGGNVPLGYRVVERKLTVDEAEAAAARHIFTRYVALGSGRALLEELRGDGYRTKLNPLKAGGVRGGRPFTRGMLFQMLSNRIYIGDIVHKGEAHRGEHSAIIDAELWDQVQATIATNKIERSRGANLRAPSLLTGILFDAHGRRMSPSHAVKGKKRYRYYVTPAGEQREGDHAPCRMPAHELEHVIVERLRELLLDRTSIPNLLPAESRAADVTASAMSAAAAIGDKLSTYFGRRDLVDTLLQRVEATGEQVVLTIDRASLLKLLGIPGDQDIRPLILTGPASHIRRGNEIRLVIGQDGRTSTPDGELLSLLKQAHEARELMLGSPNASFRSIARETGRCATRLAQLVRLSWLSPEITRMIAEGRQPVRLTPARLLKVELPSSWAEQEPLLASI